MVDRKGGRPGPEQSRPEAGGPPPDVRVIRGGELERLKASRPEMAPSRFALEWTDAEGRHHLGYNFRRTTVDRDGNSRVDFYYNAPPTFEDTYGDWHTGTAYQSGPHGDVPLGELYTLYLRKSELGRTALDRFLTDADKAGYAAQRWFSTPPSEAVGEDGSPVTSLTFLLRKRPQENQQSIPNQEG